MDSWIKYIQPDNPIAKTIVGLLLVIFLLWVAALVYLWVWLKLQQNQMVRCTDVTILKASLPDSIRERGVKDYDTLWLTANAKATFSTFCHSKSVKEGSLIARHLRAIFNAGLTEGHLETGELIKHTANGFFKLNGSLRSVLATF